MLSAQSFWSPLPSSWQLRKTPVSKKLPTVWPAQTAAAAATQAVPTTQRLSSWTACLAISALQCQGNSEHCKPAYDYKGIQTCAAAATLYGGPKTCSFACIGLGDCTKVCKFDAIHIVDGVAKVDKDKCTGCGACANICPKKVIMIDAGGPRKPVVMCSNQDKGAVANKLCTTSCIACGMCERTCKFDAIHVVDGVARVDYDKCKGCGMCAQKCPKKIILFPLKDDPYPPKPVVKPAAPAAKPAAAAAPAAKPEAKAEEAKPETKAE